MGDPVAHGPIFEALCQEQLGPLLIGLTNPCILSLFERATSLATKESDASLSTRTGYASTVSGRR
jgi:hypothetical protein